jgi:hypothetical protein
VKCVAVEYQQLPLLQLATKLFLFNEKYSTSIWMSIPFFAETAKSTAKIVDKLKTI